MSVAVAPTPDVKTRFFDFRNLELKKNSSRTKNSGWGGRWLGTEEMFEHRYCLTVPGSNPGLGALLSKQTLKMIMTILSNLNNMNSD